MAISRKRWGAGGTVPLDPVRKHSLFFHHFADPQTQFKNRAAEMAKMRSIDSFHRNSNGWNTIGYSAVLFPSGRLYWGRGPKGLPAAQGGANSGSLAVAVPGLNPRLTRRQKARMVTIAINFRVRRGVTRVGGHREAPGQATSCPGDNVMAYIPTVARRARLRRV